MRVSTLPQITFRAPNYYYFFFYYIQPDIQNVARYKKKKKVGCEWGM